MPTSQLKQAIKDVKTRLLTASGVVYSVVFNNQIKEEIAGKTFNFPKPAVLVEIQSPTQGVELLGSGVSINDNFIWRLSIVHEQLDAGSDGSINNGMDENLDVFDIRDAVKTVMSGFKPTNCSSLQYCEESMDYDHNNIYVYGISFKCAYVDTKGSPFDIDSEIYQVMQPPFDLQLDAYYITPKGIHAHDAYGWKVCLITAVIVDAPDYGAGTTYALDDTVTFGGTIYTSLAGSNTGHTPNVSPTYWTVKTQTLSNGDIIPTQYVLNGDGTLTISELTSYPGIVPLTPFLLQSNPYPITQVYNFTDNIFDLTIGGFGSFSIGDNIEFNASLPIYTA